MKLKEGDMTLEEEIEKIKEIGTVGLDSSYRYTVNSRYIIVLSWFYDIRKNKLGGPTYFRRADNRIRLRIL